MMVFQVPEDCARLVAELGRYRYEPASADQVDRTSTSTAVGEEWLTTQCLLATAELGQRYALARHRTLRLGSRFRSKVLALGSSQE